MSTTELCLWRNAVLPTKHAIVFVHGIFSNHSTFDACYNLFVGDARLDGFDLFYWDYDYNDSLENNGRLLAGKLIDRFQADDEVTIIAHSMGGLVARLAILSKHLPFVRCLFLLGTPNVGAIRMAQISMLSQLILGSLHVAFAVFPRKEGIVDLTRAGEILESYHDQSDFAAQVDYVTIPGLHFYESRSSWDFGKDLATMLFSAFQLGLGFLEAITPLLSIKLSRPHDGIVELASNNLIPCIAGRESEKKDSINFPDTSPITYAHVEPYSCRKLTHVQLHSDRDVMETIADIILAKPGPQTSSRLRAWYQGLSGQSKRRINRVLPWSP